MSLDHLLRTYIEKLISGAEDLPKWQSAIDEEMRHSQRAREFMQHLENSIEMLRLNEPELFLHLVKCQYRKGGAEKSYIRTLLKSIREVEGIEEHFALPSIYRSVIPDWVNEADAFLMEEFYQEQWKSKYNSNPDMRPRLFDLFERAKLFSPS